MAALDQPAPQAGKKPRVRKHRFHPDMTPMVDLAFLLLTFFVLTTTFAKPRVMKLTMPVKDPAYTSPLKESQAMTIVRDKNHQVRYYFGLNAPGDPSVPVPTLHKPSPAARYRDVVDILDEMSITNQKKYAITELSAADRQLLSIIK